MKLKSLIILVGCLTAGGGGCGGGGSEDTPAVAVGAVDERPSAELGVSAFAALHPGFPCERWLEPYRRARAAGAQFVPVAPILWGTFGTEEACIKRFVAEFGDAAHILEIHFSNEAGRRNERLREGEFQPHWDVGEYNRALESGSADGAIAYRLSRILEFVTRVAGPKTEVLISRGLEDNMTDAADVAFAHVFRSLTALDFVANPVSGRIKDGDYHEVHGTGTSVRAPCLASQDGTYDQSYEDSRAFLARYQHCARILWPESLQGLVGPWMPPRDRTFTLSEAQIEEITQLFIEASK